MNENEATLFTFDPSEVVATASDDWGETYSEVSAESPDEILTDIYNEMKVCESIMLLIFVAILTIFAFRFLFGEFKAWFSC